MRMNLMGKITKKLEEREYTMQQKSRKLAEDIEQQKIREKKLLEELEQTKNQYDESMKAVMNSTLDVKLKEFFQDLKEYDRYEKDAKKPDFDAIDATSTEEEVSRIFNQIQMQS